MDIIILSLSRWDGDYSSTILSMAKVFARTHRVFYLDYPFTIADLVRGWRSERVGRRIKALLWGRNIYSKPINSLPNLVVVTPLITLSINWLPGGIMHWLFSLINDRLVFKSIRRAMNDFHITKFLYLNSFNPFYGNHFPKSFKPRLAVYHCVDDITRSPYVNKHGPRLERLAMRNASITLTTSTELKRSRSRYCRRVDLLPNAADIGLFRNAATSDLPKPPELAGIPSGARIVMYMGNICHRIDYDLLSQLAARLSDTILLMVGPFGSKLYREYGLDKRSNIVFTGPKKLEELPAYVHQAHCCIIPFLCNELTRSIYPLKINEYLAAGKPVVTTAFSQDVMAFDEVVRITHSHHEFIEAVTDEIGKDHEGLKVRRIDFVKENSWENRVERFWGIVADIEHEVV